MEVATRTCARCGMAAVAGTPRCRSCRARLVPLHVVGEDAVPRGTGRAAAEAWELWEQRLADTVDIELVDVRGAGSTSTDPDPDRVRRLRLDARALLAVLRTARAAIAVALLAHATKALLALTSTPTDRVGSPWWDRVGAAVVVATVTALAVATICLVAFVAWWSDAAHAGRRVGLWRASIERLSLRAGAAVALGALAAVLEDPAYVAVVAVGAAAVGLLAVAQVVRLVVAVTNTEAPGRA
jgi:hypothetical protein